jgi:hypothetical protein
MSKKAAIYVNAQVEEVNTVTPLMSHRINPAHLI